MFRLYGFFTQNSLKTLYVAEEVVGDFKVPVLEHDGECLFESGAICRYIANVTESPLYPVDKLQRARVDQWMDFFSCHLGHWLSRLYFEAVIKPNFDLGGPDKAGIEEAIKFANLQLAMLDAHLEDSDWLANNAFSIADLFAFAYIEQHRAVELSLKEYANVQVWFERIESRPAIAKARARLPK